ncbi:hypothetical protein C8Q77DRAFT_1060884 [Trametes polyzona]|nr:hypothetical protein C8Q77DRAFT_1060884 [Trametes polyzona]
MPRANLTTVVRARAIQTSAAQASAAAAPASSASTPEPQLKPRTKLKMEKALEREALARKDKAERDEVHDLYLVLNEVKTYRGGFTRPTELRSSNWFEGGAYLQKGKNYEGPRDKVYESTTAFVLEGRYPIHRGPGYVDAFQRQADTCSEARFPELVETANSPSANSSFAAPLDDVRWPWEFTRKRKPVRWWDKGEEPQQTHHRALQEPVAQSDNATQAGSIAGRVPTEILSSRAPSAPTTHARGFHTSAVALLPDDPNSFENRKNIPGSTWSRPPRPSQDAQDDVVPTYYVERKKQRDHISQRKEEEGGLMAELNAGILSEGLAAKTRVREEKIPVEVRLPDGTIAHPSGFEPPTPETDFHPVAAKVPTEDDPLVATVKQPWDDREFKVSGAEPIIPDPEKEQEWLKRVVSSGGTVLTGVRDINAEKPAAASAKPTTTEDRSKITTSAWDSPSRSQENDPDSVIPSFYIERKKQRDHIAERKEEEGGLMVELNAGILSEDLAAQTREREEKIPVEVPLADGTIVHPSGFVPPTPETEFHPVAAKPPDSPKLPWTEIDAVKGTGAATGSTGSSKKPGDARGFHTSAVARASVLSTLSPAVAHTLAAQGTPSSVDAGQMAMAARRERYWADMKEQPFWRPLVTVTFATRPLATAFNKLTQQLERGLPFYASIEDVDRKDFHTFNARMRNLQLNRIQWVTHQLARRLGGENGGLIGVRWKPNQQGRGVNGEGLADPLPPHVRMMKIGVGEWYPFAEEVKERFLADAEQGGYRDFVEVFGLDEWGNRTDGKAWKGQQQSKVDELDVD